MNIYTTIRHQIANLRHGGSDDSLADDPRRLGVLCPALPRRDMAHAEKILIIDEMPTSLLLLESLLSRHYLITLADSAAKGLQLALSNDPPDLIILETRMSRVDGFAVCEFLQQNSKTKHIPIMFLSSLQGKKVLDRGISLGAVDFMFKPVPGAKLLERISSYFKAYGWMQRERLFARGN